jgi:transcriptional regulator of acetoin/glycerol metabolism
MQNVVEYAFAVGRGEALRLEDLPPEFREAKPPPTTAPAPAAATPQDEAARLREALAACGGKIGPAAQRLGMSRATFWRKRKQQGL